jgi:outer membrane protein assembly factor BamA
MHKRSLVFLPAVLMLCAAYAYCDLSNVQVEATKLNFSPEFQFTVPNAVVDLSTLDKLDNMSLRFNSKYDFLNNQFYANIDTRYDFTKYFAGIGFGDRVDFNLLYVDTTYFQRVKYIKPYFGYKIREFTRLTYAVDFEDTLTASTDRLLNVDQGRNTVSSLDLTYDSLDRTKAIPNGKVANAALFGSYFDLASDYEYSRGELSFTDIFQSFGDQYVELNLKTGFPLTTEKRPLSETYFAGGYQILRGYQYNELEGNMLKYMQLMYHFPLIYKLDMEQMKLQLELLTFDVFSEFAQAGPTQDFAGFENLKTSLSIGTSYNALFFSRLKVKFSLFLSKAIEANRQPILYFSLSTYSYSQNPK